MDALLTELIKTAVRLGASDIHLRSYDCPRLRIDGALTPLEAPPLSEREIRASLGSVISHDALAQVCQGIEHDCTVEVENHRLRVHVLRTPRGIAVVLRLLPAGVPTIARLLLPPTIHTIAAEERGLVLVTGPVGAGKSSTLAALVDCINTARRAHIITLEDPIEIVHVPRASLITQREIGRCTRNWFDGLRASLRQDPDVLVVGELRDPETMQLALTAAETGHLVLSTLHTCGASQTISRVIDLFPTQTKDQVRAMLAESLSAVVSQRLVPRQGGGRIANVEVLRATPAVRNLIREGKTHHIPGVIQTSANQGMFTFEQHYRRLVQEGLVPQTNNHSDELVKTPS